MGIGRKAPETAVAGAGSDDHGALRGADSTPCRFRRLLNRRARSASPGDFTKIAFYERFPMQGECSSPLEAFLQQLGKFFLLFTDLHRN